MRATPAPTRRALLSGLALSTLSFAGCTTAEDAAQPTSAPTPEDLLTAHGLEGRGVQELIEELEALPLAERPTDLLAAVMPDQLSLSDATGREASLPLPAEHSYVSVAPFVEVTHECFHHSLTTCLGELQDQDVQVLVTTTGGTVLLDEIRTTAPNGFLGLWLPRDQQLTLTLTHDGASATSPLATDAKSPTCITTMQLGA